MMTCPVTKQRIGRYRPRSSWRVREPAFVFVYGTLRSTERGALGATERRHMRWLARRIGRATISAIVFDLGGYPGAVPLEASYRKVHGEIWQIVHPRRLLPLLDAYEGVGDGGDEYARVQIDATMACGPLGRWRVAAWMYAYTPQDASRMQR